MEQTNSYAKPTFKNVHNKEYKTDDGILWHSRACAVVAHVWVIKNGEPFVLIGKRGNVTDHSGKWNIPCGYLDWNENLREAMFREVWEETGLDLSKYHGSTVFAKLDQPWLVFAEPSENRENVAMHMGMVIDLLEDRLPDLCLDNMEEEESTGAYWMHYDSALQIPKEEWAFNHLTRLQQFRHLIEEVLERYKK